MGWQPIETAPKDGTIADMWCALGFRRENIRWVDEQREGVKHPSCIMDGWKDREMDAWGSYKETSFTHWMPLPEPPNN